MKDVKIVGFDQLFKTVNLDLKNNDELSYDYAMLLIYTTNAKKGFKVKKIYKTTKNHTRVSYIPFESREDVSEYDKFVSEKVDEFNKKWGNDANVTYQAEK